jgi:hypothetical protein
MIFVFNYLPGAEMAKRKINKSQAIRDLYAKNPKMPVRMAVDALGKRGIKVASSQVYFVLGGVTGKAKRGKGEPSRTSSNHQLGNKTGMTNPIELIVDIKSLADRAGGIAHLKRLVDVLAE